MANAAALAARALDALRRENLTLACAESCTGGLFAGLITTPPGASEVFLGGVVSYQDEVKAALLRVDRDFLREVGAVTSEAARQMATGARELLGADIAVSITGFAGPSVPPGGELGRVHIAIAHAGGVESHELHFPDDRQKVREGAAEEAVRLLLEAVPRVAKKR